MEAPPVGYATTPDGMKIAYTDSGGGRPLVFLPLTLNHVQLSWRYDRRISGWLQALSQRFRLIRYDSRGQGMSTRGLKPLHAVSDCDMDLETVIAHLRLQRFIVLGYSWFSHVAVRYVAAHPERVSALILVSPATTSSAWPLDATMGLVRHAWDIFTRNFVPSGSSREETEATLAYFRQTITPLDFERHTAAFHSSDVTYLLPRLDLPTLIIHPRDFLWVSTEDVEQVASLVPRAKLVITEGTMAFGDVNQAMRAIDEFIAGLEASSLYQRNGIEALLSPRELEVLALLAHGCTNQQIADRLVISVNTAARHVASILSKTGARNRTEAALMAGERSTARPSPTD